MINKLSLEENKVPRKQFEARKVAGSATYKQSKNKVEQYDIALCVVFVNSVCLLSLLSHKKSIKIYSYSYSLLFSLKCLPQKYIVHLQQFN